MSNTKQGFIGKLITSLITLYIVNIICISLFAEFLLMIIIVNGLSLLAVIHFFNTLNKGITLPAAAQKLIIKISATCTFMITMTLLLGDSPAVFLSGTISIFIVIYSYMSISDGELNPQDEPPKIDTDTLLNVPTHFSISALILKCPHCHKDVQAGVDIFDSKQPCCFCNRYFHVPSPKNVTNNKSKHYQSYSR
ncbi:MAG: hypothetical protein HRT88_07235 [Lentisphaeraceae bacterium]|nr:hypothetical protein [Lentisphaeraceae bacterium]